MSDRRPHTQRLQVDEFQRAEVFSDNASKNGEILQDFGNIQDIRSERIIRKDQCKKRYSINAF
jgi:hypothetical protein